MNMLKGLAVIALASFAVAAAPAENERFHFALQRSVPAADATVAPPSEIQLWYTQVPQEGSLSVRLVDAGGDLVGTEAPEAQAADPKAFSVEVARPLAAGDYTVAWRGVGDDGHLVQAEFGFTVASAATSVGGAPGR